MKKNKIAFWLFFILLFNYVKSNTCADSINRWDKFINMISIPLIHAFTTKINAYSITMIVPHIKAKMKLYAVLLFYPIIGTNVL